MPTQPDPQSRKVFAELADATESKISVGGVLREIFRQWKGVEGFVREMKLDFDTCPLGHANRIRLESDIMRSLGNYDGDVDDMPDDIETLQAIVQEQLEQSEQPESNEG